MLYDVRKVKFRTKKASQIDFVYAGLCIVWARVRNEPLYLCQISWVIFLLNMVVNHELISLIDKTFDRSLRVVFSSKEEMICLKFNSRAVVFFCFCISSKRKDHMYYIVKNYVI